MINDSYAYTSVPANAYEYLGLTVRVAAKIDETGTIIVGELIDVDDECVEIVSHYDGVIDKHYRILKTDIYSFIVAMPKLCDPNELEDKIEIFKRLYDKVYDSNEPKMKPDRFKELLDELDGNSLQTLKEKNARYAQNGDCLHNFRSGADIVGGTPAQACWGYLTKHLVALRDMVQRDDFSNREDFLEKCQDTINYIRFLWCIGNDGTMTSETYFDDTEKGEN
jgi:hypothetical protein